MPAAAQDSFGEQYILRVKIGHTSQYNFQFQMYVPNFEAITASVPTRLVTSGNKMGGGGDETSRTMTLQAGGLVASSVSGQAHWQPGLLEVIGGNIATQPTGWYANFPQNETRSSYRHIRRKLQ